MCTSKQNMGLWVLGVALGMVVSANAAWANSNIQESGSVLIFPKVIANDQRDTLIEITNTGNWLEHVKCFYVNSSRPGQWSVMDFEIWLTKQQPTQWLASRGRPVNIFDDFGSAGAGFDPGRIPPVPSGFQGELKCVQVSESGEPKPVDKLIGKATLIRSSDADVATYNAIAIKGHGRTGVGDTLDLDDIEYDACPVTQTISLLAEDFDDPIVDDLSSCGSDCLSTTLTLVPCDQNLELARPSRVTLNILVYDEFEDVRSRNVVVDCWFNQRLDSLALGGGVFDNRGTLGLYARFSPAPGEGRVVGIAEELRTDDDDESSWAAFNLHAEGTRICSESTLPPQNGRSCSSDAECPGGFCIDGGADRIVIPQF